MRAFLVHWAVLTVAVWVAAALVEDIEYENWESLVAVGAVLGLLNASVKPILVKLAFPLVLLTLGLILVVLNMAMLALATVIVDAFGGIDFSLGGWQPTLAGAIIISLVGWVLGFAVKPVKGKA